MKNFYPSFLRMSMFIIFVTSQFRSQSQNLIVNPGAETGPPATTGWTAISSGTVCSGSGGWRIAGNQTGYPVAHGGTYFFFSGCGGTGTGTTYELRQDINVSGRAVPIDASAYSVTFSGYVQSFSQSPADQTNIIVEYRDAANTSVLGSFTTGVQTSISVWSNVTDARIAPAGTRFIRVRLISTSRNGDAVDAYFDDISLTAVSLLPVSFVQFKSDKQEDAVKLQWSTDLEKNNSGFNVLRSADAKNWTKIGFVAAKITTDPVKHYEFYDRYPMSSSNYYQVEQVDLDGKATYSEIQNAHFATSNLVSIFPNPVGNQLVLKTRRSGLIAEILDNQGQSLGKHPAESPITTANLRPGVYILKIHGKDFLEFKQFIKK